MCCVGVCDIRKAFDALTDQMNVDVREKRGGRERMEERERGRKRGGR